MGSVRVVSTQSQIDNKDEQASKRRIVLWIIYLLSLAAIIWFVVDGYAYYSTPYSERPMHPDYRELRPAGSRGLLFGYAGSIMMILMLVYSLRKRTGLLGQSVSLKSLLQFHIFLGIMGPLFIVLHTSFKVQGLVAVSFWSMVAVAASGFFGRYLYLQIPRNIQGSELSLSELERVTGEQTKALRERFQLDDKAVGQLEAVTSRFAGGFSGGAAHAVIRLLLDDLLRFWARRRFARDVLRAVPLPRRELREFTHLAFGRALLQRRIAMLGQVQQVFHYWHVIHKPFAIIMYLIMLIHIGVAIWTGYGWIS